MTDRINFCPRCGNQFAATDRFCQTCGSPRVLDVGVAQGASTEQRPMNYAAHSQRNILPSAYETEQRKKQFWHTFLYSLVTAFFAWHFIWRVFLGKPGWAESIGQSKYTAILSILDLLPALDLPIIALGIYMVVQARHGKVD